MESLPLSLLALLVSILSLLISFTALLRDKHILKAYSYASSNLDGKWNLKVAVQNHGKRPVSIEHVIIAKRIDGAHENLHLFKFCENGSNRIEVGQILTSTVKPGELGLSWNSFEDIRALSIAVEDALGTSYKAPFKGQMLKT